MFEMRLGSTAWGGFETKEASTAREVELER